MIRDLELPTSIQGGLSVLSWRARSSDGTRAMLRCTLVPWQVVVSGMGLGPTTSMPPSPGRLKLAEAL